MPNQHLFPTHHWPDYFKSELQIGTEREHPIAETLDEIFFLWNCVSQKQALSIQPKFFSIKQRTRVLNHLGFKTASLDTDKISDFFDELHTIFRFRNSLKAIEILANLYFEKNTIQRGRSITNYRLHPKKFCLPTKVYLDERHIWVRLFSTTESDKISEFIHNAQRLLPKAFRISVLPPEKRRTPKPTAIRLKNAQSLQFRIPEIRKEPFSCHTLPK